MDDRLPGRRLQRPGSHCSPPCSLQVRKRRRSSTEWTHPSLMRTAAALSSLDRSHFLLSIIFSGSSPMTRQRGQIGARSRMQERWEAKRTVRSRRGRRGKENQQEKKKKFLKEEGEQVNEVKRGRWRERTQRRSRKHEEGGEQVFFPAPHPAPAGCLGRPLRSGRQRSIFATSLGGEKERGECRLSIIGTKEQTGGKYEARNRNKPLSHKLTKKRGAAISKKAFNELLPPSEEGTRD